MSDREKANNSTGATRRTFLETGAKAAVTGAETLTGGTALMGARPSKKVNIGVVGGGFGSAFFWHEHPNCVVTAVSDLRADRRHRLAEHYRSNNVYEEFHPMLKDSKVDAVALWTDAPSHAQYAID